MTNLKTYQFEVALETIYAIENFDDDFVHGSDRITINLGTINVYASEHLPANKSEMTLIHENLEGIHSFDTIPNYILFAQNTGTTTSIVITGIKATEIL